MKAKQINKIWWKECDDLTCVSGNILEKSFLELGIKLFLANDDLESKVILKFYPVPTRWKIVGVH